MKEINEVKEKLREALKLLEDASDGCRIGKMAEIGELKPGDRFKTELGEFIVLDHDKENGITKVLQDEFYEEDVVFDGESCDYMKSDLKKMFDGEITEKYSEVFGNALVEHEVDLISVDMQDYGKFTCKARPMTFDEVRQYNQLIVKDLPDWWWTCTPWSTEERGWKYSVAVVFPSGFIGDNCYGSSDGVRPFCILKSDIFVSVEE